MTTPSHPSSGTTALCPFCKNPPGQKVGPPAMARCITPGCEGTKLGAVTLAEWNASSPTPQIAGGVREALEDIASFNITPDTGYSVAQAMRRTAQLALDTAAPKTTEHWETLDLLQLQQRGRAKALRMFDERRSISDPITLAQADAYEECGNELLAALSPQAQAGETKSAPERSSSLPSGESDPSVTMDYAGAGTADLLERLVPSTQSGGAAK